MTSDEFCRWLQGFFELQNPTSLTPEQLECIKQHLQLVYTKVTQQVIPPSPTTSQDVRDWCNTVPVITLPHKTIC